MANNLEMAVSKTAGAAKVVKAGFKGIRGVFRKLMQEHGEVSALMSYVSKSDDFEVRRTLYPDIRKALLCHERGELAEVYPELSLHPETRQIALDHQWEAGELERAIRALDSIDMSAVNWRPAFEHLYDLVNRHVDEEENQWFPKAQQVIGKEEAEILESRYEVAKDAAERDLDSRDSMQLH